MVSFGGANMVFCVLLLMLATIPRSPWLLVVCPYGALLAAGGFGQDLHQRGVADAEVDSLVLRRDGVAREVHRGE
jgi:hypothetical protein